MGLPKILDQYRDQRRWTCWAYIERDGKLSKVPFKPNGYPSKSDNPATWSTYEECRVAVERGMVTSTGEKLCGVGIQLYGIEGKLICLDLDKCIDPETKKVDAWAMEIVDECASYTEITPSGLGLRVMGIGTAIKRGKTSFKVKGVGIEIYTPEDKRYLTVTGDVLPGTWPNLGDISVVAQKLIDNEGSLVAKPLPLDPPPTKKGSAPALTISQRALQAAAPAPAETTNVMTLFPNQAQVEFDRIVSTGVPEGQRSEKFHHAVGIAKRLGLTPEATEEKMRANPAGIAAKYLTPQDRLSAEISRCWGKVDGVEVIEFTAASTSKAAGATKEPHGIGGYVTDKNGYPIPNCQNVAVMLSSDHTIVGIFATDTFSNKRVLLRQLPNIPGPREFTKPVQVTDTHVAALLAHVQRSGIPKATKAMAHDAIEIVASRASIHPVKQYLDGLKWDGVERVSGWLQSYLGAKPANDGEATYLKEVGRAWIISAVARIYMPGCKADAALILEGGQGIGKSSAASVLAGEWFGDNLPHMGTKDASSYLQGVWIVELAELANMARAEIEVVKSFMSRQEDRFRPAYGRFEVTVPRQCVFIGTTNADNYLKDTTGNRRFWPVKCGDVGLDALKKNRDQLWAEAKVLYEKGNSWWLTRDILRVAEVQQEARVDNDDPWTGVVLDVSRGYESTGISIAEVLLKIVPDIQQRTRQQSARVAQILKVDGWVQDGFVSRNRGVGSQKKFIKKGEEK